jgi:TPP-dependent pyruvate/acetoin dehydrogenase alpha subunit
MNIQDLVKFEDDIAQCFNDAQIKAPVHLYNGNEQQLIDIFKHIREEDWVFCTWRSHYQCLLKGVPKEELKQAILAGRSIGLCFPEHKVYSSGIVAGSIPIALGTALALKRRNARAKVWCFVGDMASEHGQFFEAAKYAKYNDLPIRFIIEDNGLSVCTDTKKTWGTERLTFEGIDDSMIQYYKYDGTKYPHAGAGTRVQF